MALDLTSVQYLRGTAALAFVIISIIIGLRIISKYFSYRQKELITVGLSWILLSSPWWGGAFAFLFYLFGIQFTPELYLFIGNFFIPFALITWIYSFSRLAYPEIKNKIFYPYLVISLGFLAFIIYALFVDYTLIGELEDELNSRHSVFSLILVIFALISLLITGTLFARKSLKSNDPQIKWKGRFLLAAFLIFIFGALLDAIVPAIPFLLVTIKLILVISGILYYLGFFLSEKLGKKLA
ncbi:MAG: conserved membrane protein of unknown function [Promethearchaeota archaeon]|nr:MAG: conserved membrane protein of unknown function [Candidatus Lokiarchaeota archaeon]